MTLTTAKVEFSQDDLSDTTPSWTDVTTYTKSVSWFSGKTSDLDAPQAGGATIVLNNQDRRFEPDYSAGAYSPNIKPMRRFRLTMTADGTAHTQGIYYASSWSVGYPARTTYSDVTVTCTDGIGILSLDTLPTLTPPDASTYADVVIADNPFAYYPMQETTGTVMDAAAGPPGVYKPGVILGQYPNAVLGDDGGGAYFPVSTVGFARAKLDDGGVWHDTNQCTAEVVVNVITRNTHSLFAGPLKASAGSNAWSLNTDAADITQGVSTSVAANYTGGNLSVGRHHVAMTWDGSVVLVYIDGVLDASQNGNATILSGDDADFLYVGGTSAALLGPDCVISHAATYDYALNAAQVASHANAALNRGYASQTTGARVAALATNALWSTAGITGGQLISVAPRFQNGQAKFNEISLVAQAEQPYGLFYFDDSGNPAYQGSDYDATSAATFSDSGSDVAYDGITVVYDDDLYNNVTIARNGGDAQTHVDTASESAYMTRGYNQTGLILSTDSDADLVAAGVLDAFNAPRIRVASISLNGGTQTARAQILTREIGDTIRVKRRTDTGEAIDVITRILGKQKSISPDGLIHCTWNLARGIDASDAHWHLGITGFSELNSTTILA